MTGRRQSSTHFLKGPIPWAWLASAIALPGHALAVGMALWFWAGMRQTSTVRLSTRSFPAAVSRSAIYRGLRSLETAGLVTVERRRGHPPLVTLQGKS